jgi:predicted HAD superfamily phosphohydrolase YqeG
MIVGDRLLTDVYLGNIMGWVSVHTQPIEPTTIVKHGVGVFIMRTVEKYFL